LIYARSHERISLYRPDTFNRRSGAWRQVQIRTPRSATLLRVEGSGTLFARV